MPRRRKGNNYSLPPREIRIPRQAIFNQDVSDAAFRLLAVIAALSWETGACDLNNSQLAQVLGKSRQFVSSLLRDLSAMDLVSDLTLDGKRCLELTFADDSSPWRGDLFGRGLFEAADGTFEPQAPPKSGRASGSSRTPHVLSTTDNTVLSTGDNINAHVEEEESLKDKIDSSSSGPGMSTGDNIKQDMLSGVDNTFLDEPFARISALWCRYFGDITAVEADLLGDFLDDGTLGNLAAQGGETAEVWIVAAIEEAAMAEAKQPVRYFRKTLNNWIQRGNRSSLSTPKGQQVIHEQTHEQNGRNGSQSDAGAIKAILDSLERGEISPDTARQQLAAGGGHLF